MNAPHTRNRIDPSDKLAAAARAAGISSAINIREITMGRRRRQPAVDRPSKPPSPLPPHWPVGLRSITLADLMTASCRFPVGAASGENQLFCGETRDQPKGSPYCAGCRDRVSGKAKNDVVFH